MSIQGDAQNLSQLGTQYTQNPSLNDVIGLHSSLPKPTKLLKGSSAASLLENTDNEQNKHTSNNNISYKYNMIKNNLSKLTKQQLIKLLLNKQAPKPAPRTQRRDWTKEPIPYPRKSVKQMVQDHENNIIAPAAPFADKPKPWPRNNIIKPPKQFRDKPKAAPRTKKIAPTRLPRTEINETARAFQGFTTSYHVGIKNETNPLVQLNTTRLAIADFMKQLLPRMKGLKFIETLTITFEQQRGNQIVCRIGYFNSKPKTIINAIDLTPFLDVNVEQIMEDIHKWISDGSAWLIKSINGHYINIIQYEPLAGSSYIELPTELQHSKKGIINLQNEDNQCFRRCHIRHLNTQKRPTKNKKKR